eukprot:NODE_288_length_11703_cov_0.386591.p9 type:complete len:113 gc:universal NODE_288_length_11703_cov_0.386591:2749-2411(-)
MSQIIDTLSASFASLNDENRSEMLKKINSVFILEIDGQQYVLDFKNGSIKPGDGTAGDVTIVLKESDLVDIVAGKSTSQNAFMKGKLKIKGNMMTALKLDTALKTLQKGAKL